MIEGQKAKMPHLKHLWRICQKDELELIDAAAYDILQTMGVHIDDKDCINYLKDAPVTIDEQELIVKFPEWWVRSMLSRLPRNMILGSRAGKNDLPINGPQRDFYTLICSGATKMYVWNEGQKQWESKDTTEEDVIRTDRMIGAIPAYEGFYGTVVEDVEKTKQGLPAELHTAFQKMKWTTKHGGPVAITEGGVPEWDFLGRMSSEIMGGADELAKRPIVAGLPTCIGPLTSTRQNFWAMIGAAKWGLVTYPYWGGTTPFTAPATGPAATILSLACTHYGMACSEYLKPGVPALPWPFVTPTDPQTGQLAMNPFSFISPGIATQVYQDLYGLATSSCSYCLTSALDEAAATWTASLLSQAIWGGNVVQVGTTPQAFMEETIPMGETIVNLIKQMFFEMSEDFLKFDEEHIGMDVIKRVGPKGMFTTDPHTLKWIEPKMGLFWHSNDWIHEHADQWLARGAPTWVDICRKRMPELAKYVPDPEMPKDVEERCNAIMKEADAKLAIF